MSIDLQTAIDDIVAARDIEGVLALGYPADRTVIGLNHRVNIRGAEVGYDNLSMTERVVLCINALEAEVNNGGFDQYFLNSAGDHARDAARALNAIGAQHTARLVEEAMSVFPAGAPSTKQQQRGRQLASLPEHARRRLNDLDEEFYEYRDNLTDLLMKYARAHKEDLR